MPFGAGKVALLGAAGSGGGSEGGTFEWIGGTTVSDTTTNSITLSGFSASDYQEWFFRWSFAGSNPTDINFQANGDTGSNYYSNEWWIYNSLGGANGNSSHDQLRMVWTGGTSSGYAAPVAGIISVSGANVSSKPSFETLSYRSLDTYSGYGTFDFGTTLRAVSAAVVSSVTLFAQSTSNYFDVGDTVQMFGVKKTSD